MLKDIQIKIVLIFLIIGAIIIGTLGYINYTSLSKILEIMPSDTLEYADLAKYQGNIKVTTLCSILVFSLICIIVRSICN